MSRALLFLQHFPGGAAPGRATRWWCGLRVSRRRCAWPGYWLVVRPVGFPAALRLDGLLVDGAACGMGSPGEAFMPTPGKFTGARCEKSPYFRTSSYLEYGGEGGIDSLRSPLLGPSMGLAPSGPTQALFKNAHGVFVGAARLLRSRSAQLAAPVVEPSRGFSSPPTENIKEKSPYFRTSSHLEYGGEGGIDSLRSPLRGSLLTAFAVCPTGCASCRTPVGGSHPPCTENIKEKSPYFRTSSHLEYGGEGGIRTPDTLPYTHFPGVLLQPLGHLTILSCCSPWVGNGALL